MSSGFNDAKRLADARALASEFKSNGGGGKKSGNKGVSPGSLRPSPRHSLPGTLPSHASNRNQANLPPRPGGAGSTRGGVPPPSQRNYPPNAASKALLNIECSANGKESMDFIRGADKTVQSTMKTKKENASLQSLPTPKGFFALPPKPPTRYTGAARPATAVSRPTQNVAPGIPSSVQPPIHGGAQAHCQTAPPESIVASVPKPSLTKPMSLIDSFFAAGLEPQVDSPVSDSYNHGSQTQRDPIVAAPTLKPSPVSNANLESQPRPEGHGPLLQHPEQIVTKAVVSIEANMKVSDEPTLARETGKTAKPSGRLPNIDSQSGSQGGVCSHSPTINAPDGSGAQVHSDSHFGQAGAAAHQLSGNINERTSMYSSKAKVHSTPKAHAADEGVEQLTRMFHQLSTANRHQEAQEAEANGNTRSGTAATVSPVVDPKSVTRAQLRPKKPGLSSSRWAN